MSKLPSKKLREILASRLVDLGFGGLHGCPFPPELLGKLASGEAILIVWHEEGLCPCCDKPALRGVFMPKERIKVKGWKNVG